MKIDKASGLLEQSEFIESPNFDDRPQGQEVSLLVVHGISLPAGKYGGPWISQLFTNCLSADDHDDFADICDLHVSSHFLIRRDGSVIQYVPVHHRAWHAGVSCFEQQHACNDYSVGIELEGTDDEPYTSEQYDQLIELAAAVMDIYPSITLPRIVGHADIAPGRKTDPGESFDWQQLRKKLSFKLASLNQVDNT